MTMMLNGLRRLGIWLATGVDLWIGWHRLPSWLGLGVLVGIRSRLRLANLTDTGLGLRAPAMPHPPPAHQRAVDGTYNDLRCPAMGSAGTPFGRNVPLEAVWAEPYFDGRCTSAPSPRTVSNELLSRREFEAAGNLNVLAAAWIQFMIHDWVSHGPTPGPDAPRQIEIPLSPGDPWPHGRMRVPRALADTTRPAGSEHLGPTFPNLVTHWWDASQLYGSAPETLKLIRTRPSSLETAPHGKIAMDPQKPGLLPIDPQTMDRHEHRTDLTGFNDNWWVGLSLLHTLFALEHNRICELLAAAHPTWSGDEIFARARLANAAVLAKIHTLEWTPAILDHPTVHAGMRGIWWGLEGERGIIRLLGYIMGPEVQHGIRYSRTDHHGVPYSITEEFVSVYRMHALMPDAFDFRSLRDPSHHVQLELREVVFGHARKVVEKHGFSMADVASSFGVQSAGALTLHNFPNAFRDIELPNGLRLDLAAVDVLRDRERGVPRYNDLRRLLHRPAVRSFEQLVGRAGRDRGWARELRRVYGNVDSVDTMVGLFAEPKPRGFGFSDTAFRIFLFMAGRRIRSDRFFTTDFNERTYTREGLDWIDKRTMAGILSDHLGLAEQLAGVRNPFLRWDRPGTGGPLP